MIQKGGSPGPSYVLILCMRLLISSIILKKDRETGNKCLRKAAFMNMHL